MLSYSIKLDDKSIQRDELVWSEKYLAPDLSFVSGVTSQDYHLEKKKQIAFSIGNDTNADALNISCNNVTRNGYIVIKDKTYDIKSGNTVNYTTDTTPDYRYVEINGVVYYISAGTASITVKNWLKEAWSVDGEEYTVNIVESDVEAKVEGNFVYLDTIVWIEDETVEIDGHKYIFDRYDISSAGLSPGGIKYYDDGECLPASAITRTKHDEIYYNHFTDTSEYIYVTKFVLTQKELRSIPFDRLSFCTYFYYVKYKDNYCPVHITYDNENDSAPGKYMCEVLKRLYTESIEDYYETSEFTVYYTNDNGDDTELTTDIVSRISLLKDFETYIIVEGARIKVEYLLQNANHGDELAVYLTYDATNISIGETITLENCMYDDYVTSFYTMGSETFVLYNNKKYKIEERLCDKVMINNHEYPIEYINGIKKDEDALVDIVGEKVPMKILNDGCTKLQRYGEIIVRVPDQTDPNKYIDSATTVTYDIIKHDGVNINGKIYQVYSALTYNDEEEEVYDMFAQIEEKVPFEFTVNSIEGSSLLICTPNFSLYEFNDEFRDRVNASICDYFVENQRTSVLYIKNRSFGRRVITSDIGYMNGTENPESSNDYYNLFDSLKLYTDTAHIHIPIKLDIDVAGNVMQDDIVERDFYEAERKKAINGIVDMEKDVYVPKYICNSDDTIKSYLNKQAITPEDKKKYKNAYIGSYTEFFPISEIEINPHFRTRNLDNWKVNDGNSDSSVSGTADNWFVTDFYPYSGMLETNNIAKYGNALQNTSDLMGLLYFTNDDIYYQKSKVGKSFVRLSYYDTTDPQTQSLMATSTVFMDEHRLFKKFIDNSRKNIYDYGIVEEPGELHKTVNNKISIMTEFIKEHTYYPKKTSYEPTEISASTLSGDTRRISSRMIINNKYETDTSSEGFYLYMFKEYSEKLRPKPIYMKIEFNHAGVGRTIPFIVPMHWVSGTSDTYRNDKTNIFNPASALTLSSVNDITELKTGYPLSYVYAQTYIPIYAVYDYRNKEYAYIFDERYITPPSMNNGRIVLNLFELKIADESSTTTDGERENVTMGRGTKALININTNQFDRKHFSKDYR